MNELFRRMLLLPEQASTLAYEIDVLHYVVITVSVLGAAAVTLVTGVYLLRYQRRHFPPVRPDPLPTWLEAAGILLLLGIFCLFWLIGFRQFLRLRTPPDDAMDVYVVGKQWMWSFAYPDGSASNHDLVVPVDTPVRLTMTSRDVIHSFFVPSFRIKQDVLPGLMTVVWFEAVAPGVYDIFCTEYCGTYHSTMRGRVVVLADEDYESWRRRQATPLEDLVAIGRRVAAERGCLRCHTLDGTPHLGPSFAGLYRAEIPLADGRVVRADEAYLTRSMMEPQTELHRGYAPIMPSYLGVLDAGESAALVELIRSLADLGAVHPTSPPPRALPGPVELEKAWP